MPIPSIFPELGSIGYQIAKLLDTNAFLLGFFYVLRGCRPLRLVNNIEACKAMIDAMVQSAPALRDVTIVLMFFAFVVAILGMQLLKGSMWKCQVRIGLISGSGLGTLLLGTPQY